MARLVRRAFDVQICNCGNRVNYTVPLPRRVPQIGEVISLTEHGGEPEWYVQHIHQMADVVVLRLLYLLDQDMVCVLMLPTRTLEIE